LKLIGIAGCDPWIVLLGIDLLCALPRVVLGQQPLYRFFRWIVRVAIIKIAVREGQVHGLVKRVYVPRRVVSQVRDIEIFENIQRLQQDWALDPGRELVNLDAPITGLDRRLEICTCQLSRSSMVIRPPWSCVARTSASAISPR